MGSDRRWSRTCPSMVRQSCHDGNEIFFLKSLLTKFLTVILTVTGMVDSFVVE